MVLFKTSITSAQTEPVAENNPELADNMPEEPKLPIDQEQVVSDKMFEKAVSVVELEDKLNKLNEMPDIPKESVGKKTKQELLADIKRLELALGKQHKPVSKFSRVQLEQYIVSLLDESARTIQNNDINAKLDNIKMPKDEKLKTNMEELKQRIREGQAQKPSDQGAADVESKAMAEFLYRANFLLMYGLEHVTKAYEDELGTSVAGATDQMIKDKNDILIPIFMKLYKEHADTIKQYASPVMELAFYNVTLLSSSAAINVKKKLEKKQ